MFRRAAAVTAVLVCGTLLPLPAAAAEPGPLTLFTIDRAWDSGSQATPVLNTYASPAVTPYLNGLHFAKDNVTLIVTPPAGLAFTAGTSFPAGKTQSESQGRLNFYNGCGGTSATIGTVAGTVSVQGVTTSETGAVTSLTASFDAACAANPLARFAGVVRYASPDGYVATSVATTGSTLTGVGRPTVLTTTITNAGTLPTTMAASVVRETSHPDEYVVTDDGCAGVTVAPGAACAVAVTFTPASLGYHPAKLSVAATGHPREIGALAFLRGAGTSPPPAPTGLTAYQSLEGLGLAWTRDPSGEIPASYVVYRRADAVADWAQVATPAATSWVDPTVAPGQAAEYAVAAVGVGGESARSAVLAAARPAAVPVPGTGRALVLDNDAGTLAPAYVDAARSGHSLTYSPAVAEFGGSGGGATARVSVPLVVAGTYAAVTGTPGPGQVKLSASSGSTGCGLVGTLTVDEAAFDATRAPQVFTASFTGTCAGGTVPVRAEVRVNSAVPFAYASVEPGQVALARKVGVAADQVLTYTSLGSRPVTPGTPAVGGAGAADWSVVSSDCGAVLATDQTCAVTLRFTPSVRGRRDAVLRVPDDTPRGARVVPLSGTGGDMPSAVPSLTATTTLGGISLRWAAADPNDLPITEYRVYRGEGTAAPVLLAAASVLGHVDRTAETGVPYTYAVAAVNGAGEGPLVSVSGARGRAQVLFAGATTYGKAGLYATSPTGGDAVPIEVDGADHFDPAVSPDGRWVVYARGATWSETDLWVRRTDGTGTARRLTDAAGADVAPAWSPDGLRIAFEHSTGPSDVVTRVVPAGGGVPVTLDTNVGQPSWSVDNEKLVVTDYTSPAASLRLIGPGGSAAIAGTAEGTSPAVSPDGRWIAFDRWDGVRGILRTSVVPFGGGTRTDLPDTARDHGGPAWRGDGKAIYTTGWSAWTATTWVTPFAAGTFAAGTPLPTVPGLLQFEPVHNELGVHLPTRPALTGGSATLAFAMADQPAGTAFSCRVDAGLAAACTSPWRPARLASGRHTVTVTATAPGGGETVVAHRWTVDATAPAATMAAVPATTLTAARTFSYGATDSGSGVASYDVRYRRAARGSGFAAYVYPAAWQRTTSRTVSLPTTPGNEYCASVRARDKMGNVGLWTAERCTAMPLDDRALTASTGWVRGTGTGYYRGTHTTVARTGAALSIGSVVTRRITLVADRCPTCGSVSVYVGSKLVGTVSLAASTTQRARLVPLPVLPVLTSGTLVVRTASAKRVRIDGVAVRRT